MLFLLTKTALDEDQEAPLITPNQRDVTVKPGDNYDFTCESTEPVTWIYDDYIKRAYEEDRERAHRKWFVLSSLCITKQNRKHSRTIFYTFNHNKYYQGTTPL